MTKIRGRLPVLRRHKRSRRAYAAFNGAAVWFGPWTDVKAPEEETQAAFDAYLARWLARGRRPEEVRGGAVTVASLCARYLQHLQEEYPAGWHTNNGPRIDQSIEILLRLFGAEPAAEFSPLRLKTVRECMIQSGRLSRTTINERVRILRRAFGWAVSEELIPASVIEGLNSVRALQAGKPGVREPRDVRPVDRATVEATLAHLPRPVYALVELMWFTGARPSELFPLRPCDIDRSGSVWRVELDSHKTRAKGKRRVLLFGPAAQRVIEPFLLRPSDRPLFSLRGTGGAVPGAPRKSEDPGHGSH